MKKLAFLAFVGAVLFLLSNTVFAEINLTDCATLDQVDTYVLQNDLNLTYDYGQCFYPVVNGITLDCQGHTVDGQLLTANFMSSSTGATVKNCRATNFYNAFSAGEDETNTLFINNTISNVLYCIGGYYDSGVVFENNTVTGVGQSCVPVNGINENVKNNYFSASVVYPVILSPLDPNYFGNNKIYNNYFGQLPYILSDIAYTQMDVSLRPGNGILGYDFIAGNFYNDICDDLDCNGICDNPKVFNDNVTDFYPLSVCYTPPTPPPPPYNPPVSTLEKLSEDFSCSGNNSLIRLTTYGYCGNVTCTTTVFNSTFTCTYGCDTAAIPNQCNPSTKQANFNIAIIAILIIGVLIVAFWWLSKKR